MFIIIAILIISTAISLWEKIRKRRRHIRNRMTLLGNHYLDSKALYLELFRIIPNSTFVGDLDVSAAYKHIRDKYGTLIADIYQSCSLNRDKGEQQFDKTIFVLSNKMIIELAPRYAIVLFPKGGYQFVDLMVKEFALYKVEEKKEAFEMNIISLTSQGLELKTLEIKPTRLDIGLYYNDDFLPVHEVVQKRLLQENDKGIILLHGLPGTGKTTYLRHLIGEMKKKLLFVSPSVAANLMNPEFLDLLIDNPNSVIVIEDAENILMDRKYNSNSTVSNLLNISDGLLSDCLNVQIICTFNSSLSMVDEALMRKGRLIAKYEFGKLSIEKAQRLSDHLGLQQHIFRPMTLAEIMNPEEREFKKEEVAIGFRMREASLQ
ncbi:MAG TPA: AAA family ATPase [Flavitalea sp.]|nr:AAA family ATPase [Flavitalea sp.]